MHRQAYVGDNASQANCRLSVRAGRSCCQAYIPYPTILSAGTLTSLDKLADSGCGIDYLEKFAAYFSWLRENGKGNEAALECPHGPVYPGVSRLKLVVDWVLYPACA